MANLVPVIFSPWTRFCKQILVRDQILQASFGLGPDFASKLWSGTRFCNQNLVYLVKYWSVLHGGPKFACKIWSQTKACLQNLVPDRSLLAKSGPGPNFACKIRPCIKLCIHHSQINNNQLYNNVYVWDVNIVQNFYSSMTWTFSSKLLVEHLRPYIEILQ